MSTQNNELSLWLKALQSGIPVPEPVQLRIFKQAKQAKDWDVLVALALKVSDLSTEVDELLSKETRADVMIAWIGREGRSHEEIQERIDSEKRVTVLASLSSVSDLPQAAYVTLAKKSNVKGLNTLWGNPSLDEDSKFEVALRTASLYRDAGWKKLSYDDERGVTNILKEVPSAVAKAFEGRSLDFLDRPDYCTGYSEFSTIEEVVLTALNQKDQGKLLLHICERWKTILGSVAEDAITDWDERSAIRNRRWDLLIVLKGVTTLNLSDEDSAAVASWLDQMVKTLSADIAAIKTSGRSGWQLSDYLRFVEKIVEAQEIYCGDIEYITVPLQTGSREEMREAAKQLLTQVPSTTLIERSFKLILENPVFDLSDFAWLGSNVRDGDKYNHHLQWLLPSYSLRDFFVDAPIKRGESPLDVAKFVLNVLENDSNENVNLPAFSSTLLEKVAFHKSENGRNVTENTIDDLVEFCDLVLAFNNKQVTESFARELACFKTQCVDNADGTPVYNKLGEILAKYVSDVSVDQLENPHNDLAKVLWGLVFDAIPADNDQAWTQFFALVDTGGPIGAVLRSVKRLIKVSQADSETDNDGQLSLVA